MAGKNGRKGPETQQLPKALRSNTDAKRQSNRRVRLTDAFGPAVDIHMSVEVKARLDTLIEGQHFLKPDDSISPGTAGRCAALAELINQFYFDAVVWPETEVGKKIAGLYGDIWEYRVIGKMTPEAIALRLNENGRKRPVLTESGSKWSKEKWNTAHVTEMCETEYVLSLISRAEESTGK